MATGRGAASVTAAVAGACPLLVAVVGGGYLLAPAAGRLAAVGVAGIFVALGLAAASGPAGASDVGAALLALTLLVGAGEWHARRIARVALARERAEEERARAERRLAAETRLSRSLAAVASGLQSSYEPRRMLQRFTTLIGTLLRADAALLLVALDGRRTFRVLESSVEADVPETSFAIEGLEHAVGPRTFSFSAGDSGLLGALMRERFQAAAGCGMPILRGKQLAGLLLVAYRESGRTLSEVERSILAGSAALGATLFESVRLQHELRVSNQVKNDFISTVSHELRTPLNAIIGYCDLLRDGTMGEVNDDQRDALDRLMRHGVEFAELIESILEVDRLEGAYISVNWIETDLDVFFRQIAASIPAYWKKDGVELRFEGEARRVVRTDPEKLKLSIRNLIHNALQFTSEGEVVVRMTATPGTLMFSVTDTGVGIRPEVKESLFQMFQPGDRTNTRTRGGLGLGLYLADRMVKALWGQISLDSEPGAGTTARIVLPIEEPLPDGIADVEASAP